MITETVLKAMCTKPVVKPQFALNRWPTYRTVDRNSDACKPFALHLELNQFNVIDVHLRMLGHEVGERHVFVPYILGHHMFQLLRDRQPISSISTLICVRPSMRMDK